MRLPPFDLLTPSTQEEVISLLCTYPEAKIIAGGTDLLVAMRQGLLKATQLISLRLIPDLSGIGRLGDGSLRIGSMARLSSVVKTPEVRSHYPAVSDAARLIAAPALQNMATVGGNLSLDTRCFFYNQSNFWRRGLPSCFKMGGDVCHVVKGGDRCWAAFQGDLPPVLMVMGAKVTVKGPQGEKTSSLVDIYTGLGEMPMSLEQGMLITGVVLPPRSKGMGASYEKLRLRSALDFPLVSVAASVERDDGVCRDALMVIGAVAPGPVKVDVHRVLKGKKLQDGLEDAVELAFEAAHPVANVGSTPLYRRKMVRVLAKRALQRAWEQART